MFVGSAFLFTLRFWEIKDYSSRNDVKIWLHNYIADGWWRRGGLKIIISACLICLCLGLLILSINTLANGFGADSISNGLLLSSVGSIGFSVVFLIWLLSMFWMRITEQAFIRYVSQNIAYTSIIILKRVVKAKVDIGLVLVISLFMPVIYTLLQAQLCKSPLAPPLVRLVTHWLFCVYVCMYVFLVFLDWNDTTAATYRKGNNYYVPCYSLAFPPFKANGIDSSTCPVASYSSIQQKLGSSGFYKIQPILSCDSYFGIIIHCLSTSFTVYLILLYFYILHHMIHQVVKEFQSSKWADILLKLIRIREEEIVEYKVSNQHMNTHLHIVSLPNITPCISSFSWEVVLLSVFAFLAS